MDEGVRMRFKLKCKYDIYPKGYTFEVSEVNEEKILFVAANFEDFIPLKLLPFLEEVE